MAFKYAGRIAKIYGRGLLPFHILRCYESKSLYHKDCKITENEMMKMNSIAKKILSITLLMLLAASAAADVNVTVNAPEYVLDTFEVTIDITEVSDMNGGQFDLTFDPDVTNVLDVEDGKSEPCLAIHRQTAHAEWWQDICSGISRVGAHCREHQAGVWRGSSGEERWRETIYHSSETGVTRGL